MAWGQRGLPPHIRRKIIARDRWCQLGFAGCTERIDEIDHIINVASRGLVREHDTDPNNLQGVCKHCHHIKTQAEALAGRTAWKRKPERHPGYVGGTT